MAGPGVDDRRWARRGPELLLVRPDGHIAARAPLTRAGAIGACIEQLLRTGHVTAA
ncbi:MAG: hypothetical protein JNK56_02350 [Myxococcales bacterium]|nr:hypothetical protein [Myxococcales bacterium]